MKKSLKEKLLHIAKNKISNKDPSHDFSHSLRVLTNAELIAKKEKCDLEIIIPAAIFHDVIGFPRNIHAQKSADEVVKILNTVPEYPKEKIKHVEYAIRMHSFKGRLETIEAKIIQDADNLEITGAIIIMRMFASAGFMGRAFYDLEDPWCKNRELDGSQYTLDYYFKRVLKVESEIHTTTAKKIVKRRMVFVKQFIKELKIELEGK